MAEDVVHQAIDQAAQAHRDAPGNGGMLFPFAGRARLVALDVYIDKELLAFRRSAGIRLLHLVGEASRIPLASHSVDLVIMAETVEHLAEPRHERRDAAAEALS